MSQMSPATALRQLQQAQAGLKKARQLMRTSRKDPDANRLVLKVGWESLARAHSLMAAIPMDAATEPVMSRQLSVERYATALLVRLRRLIRNEAVGEGEEEEDLEVEDDDSEI